ncbi:MAG: hypothetical protein ACT6FF_09830, partial [Methanosarcinaceae archaeon]
MISRNFVFNYLKEKQDSAGGYTDENPPRTGPVIEPTLTTVPIIPIAFPRSVCGNADVTMAAAIPVMTLNVYKRRRVFLIFHNNFMILRAFIRHIISQINDERQYSF